MQSGERVGIDHLLCVTLLNEIRQSPTGPELRWDENSVTPKRVQRLLTLTANSPEGLKLIAGGALFPEREQMSYSIEKQIEEWLAQRGSEDLPGKGKPLDLDDYFRCPEDLRLGYSLLKNAGYVPEEVEQLQQIARLIDELDKCADPGVRSHLRSQLNETRVRLNLRLEATRRRRRG
jgi:hypothetical protein